MPGLRRAEWLYKKSRQAPTGNANIAIAPEGFRVQTNRIFWYAPGAEPSGKIVRCWLTMISINYFRMEEQVMARPILFNSDMVRAILEGRKTVTRRVIKPQFEMSLEGTESECSHEKGFWDMGGNEWACRQCGYGVIPMRGGSWIHAPYGAGDILYVRETWGFNPCTRCANACNTPAPDTYKGAPGCFVYRTDYGSSSYLAKSDRCEGGEVAEDNTRPNRKGRD